MGNLALKSNRRLLAIALSAIVLLQQADSTSTTLTVLNKAVKPAPPARMQPYCVFEVHVLIQLDHKQECVSCWQA